MSFESLTELVDHLGGISPDRVKLNPKPGTATEADLLDTADREDRLFEIIDGVLVEKATSFRASLLAVSIVVALRAFVDPRNLGLVSGANGPLRLSPNLIRSPSAAFVSWARIPGGRMPKEPFPDLVPDLAVEVLSPSNTAREMTLKRRHYFEAGVRLVWIVDPKRRTVAVYTGPDRPTRLRASVKLDGGDVLPGFTLPLARLFADLDRRAPG
ncbi:MAG TPA: Uma2 family endonuclease [Isosphaeraceae bacterium]